MRPATSHDTLAELTERLASTGIAASRVLPSLLAALDQHSADLRDRLSDGRRGPSPASLAGYCAGLVQTATGSGWRRPDARDVNWRHADWLVLRLVAACQLAGPAN